MAITPFKILRTKFYQNRLCFVEDTTKTFSLTFFFYTVYLYCCILAMYSAALGTSSHSESRATATEEPTDETL